MNLPNALTVFRALLVPVFAYLYRRGEPLWAMVVFLLAAATDVLDGYLARRWNQITSFGKLMDPLADKLMTLTMLFCLVSDGRLPVWTFYAMLFKECLMVLGGAFLLKGRSVVVKSNWTGKAATALMVGAVALLFPWHDIAWLAALGRYFVYAAVALAAFALVSYARIYFKSEETE